MSASSWGIIKIIYKELSKNEKKELILLQFLILLTSFFEIAGIFSIMPFLAVVTRPDIVETNKYLNIIYHYSNCTSISSFIFILGFIMLLLMTISNIISAFTAWGTYKVSYGTGRRLSLRLFDNYINSGYDFFLTKSSSNISRNLYQEINRIVNSILTPMLIINAKAVVASSIMISLFFIEPIVCIVLSVVFGIAYGTIFYSVKKKLLDLGAVMTETGERQFRLVRETFLGIKEIKILEKENYFKKKYSLALKSYSDACVFGNSIAQIPRYLIELIAFGSLIVVIMVFLSIKDKNEDIIPLLSVFAVAGYKLMPSFQQIFAGLSNIKSNLSAFDIFVKEIKETEAHKEIAFEKNRKLPFETSITGEDIYFTYKEKDITAIKGLKFIIKKKACIGIVGSSGSGKTTLINLLLGLLRPTSGRLKLDNVTINNRCLKSWQRNIGYIPQSIFLVDSDIVSNIAFGLEEDEIDMDQVIFAAKKAKVHDFITQNFKEGYKAKIGENGIRLSGGQKQRIGIARALYRRPKILIMDEGTSALDNTTERKIMNEIYELAKDMTIIMVAHRLSSLKKCEEIFFLKKGKIASVGSFNELVLKNQDFKEMLECGSLENREGVNV